jgi:hypothetical protein
MGLRARGHAPPQQEPDPIRPMQEADRVSRGTFHLDGMPVGQTREEACHPWAARKDMVPHS